MQGFLWSDNWGLSRDQKRVRRAKEAVHFLVALWVALCRSLSDHRWCPTSGLLKTHSLGLALGWAQDCQRREYIWGDGWQVWGSHPEFSAHPDSGEKALFQRQKDVSVSQWCLSLLTPSNKIQWLGFRYSTSYFPPWLLFLITEVMHVFVDDFKKGIYTKIIFKSHLKSHHPQITTVNI